MLLTIAAFVVGVGCWVLLFSNVELFRYSALGSAFGIVVAFAARHKSRKPLWSRVAMAALLLNVAGVIASFVWRA
jgi:hypothetical protein